MSPEESQLLKSLFDRVKTASNTPRDPEAENLIDQSVREVPQAPYYLAQAVIVQEKGLEAAAAHIKQLEERVHQLEAGNADPHHVTQGGFLSSIFGSNEPQASAPRNPAPRNDTAGQTQGPWGRSNASQQGGPWGTQSSLAPSTGGSFLQGALGTAAGVAGGMLLANSLSGIFGNHMAALGLGSTGANAPTEEATADKSKTDDNDDDLRQANDDLDAGDDPDNDDFGGDDVSDA
jgi:hypothetical protein